MPILKNSRHERFCIESAKGKTLKEAAVLAGYKDNCNLTYNTGKLIKRPEIRDRLEELKQLTVDQFVKSRLEILQALGRIIDKGSDGNKIRACQLSAHMQGFLSDTININSTKKAEELSDEDLQAFIKSVKVTNDDKGN